MNLLIRVALVLMVFFGNLLALVIAATVARAVWRRDDAVPDSVLGAVAGFFYGLNRDRGR